MPVSCDSFSDCLTQIVNIFHQVHQGQKWCWCRQTQEAQPHVASTRSWQLCWVIFCPGTTCVVWSSLKFILGYGMWPYQYFVHVPSFKNQECVKVYWFPGKQYLRIPLPTEIRELSCCNLYLTSPCLWLWRVIHFLLSSCFMPMFITVLQNQRKHVFF